MIPSAFEDHQRCMTVHHHWLTGDCPVVLPVMEVVIITSAVITSRSLKHRCVRGPWSGEDAHGETL
jgi:hypothetical protein